MNGNLPKHCFLRLHVYNTEPHFGRGVIALMSSIRDGCSLRGACKTMNLAYSKAWKLIKAAEADLDTRLVVGVSGGSGGGGSRLTPEGEELLERYLRFEKAARESVASLFLEHFGEQAPADIAK